MIKVSFHKIIMKKSRIWPFLTLGLAECTKGLAKSGELAESTMELAESMTQKHKNRILPTSFKQTSNNLIETNLALIPLMGFSHKNFPMCACKTLMLGSRFL